MKFVVFCHSILSCWNHGNAHFLRGIARELIGRGHDVRVFEPSDGWSRTNLLHERGEGPLSEARTLVPGIGIKEYDLRSLDLDEALDAADVVLVHEWTDPELVARIGRKRKAGGRFTLFFHDTHHRAITAPHEIARFDLSGYDAVLAFGEVLREIYASWGWGRRAHTWHEAADTALFQPLTSIEKTRDLVWIGNWGDDERDRELNEFLIEPAVALKVETRIHGVRYPPSVEQRLASLGIDYAGWLANHRVPQAFAQARVTVHVPRRAYVQALRGIPTIRVFEALACGIPLVSAPWDDAEGLFPAGAYLKARTGEEMQQALSTVLRDHACAEELAQAGLQSIKARHNCSHRVDELLGILATLNQTKESEVIAA
jgi:spore maturation protein CgeB